MKWTATLLLLFFLVVCRAAEEREYRPPQIISSMPDTAESVLRSEEYSDQKVAPFQKVPNLPLDTGVSRDTFEQRMLPLLDFQKIGLHALALFIAAMGFLIVIFQCSGCCCKKQSKQMPLRTQAGFSFIKN